MRTERCRVSRNRASLICAFRGALGVWGQRAAAAHAARITHLQTDAHITSDPTDTPENTRVTSDPTDTPDIFTVP